MVIVTILILDIFRLFHYIYDNMYADDEFFRDENENENDDNDDIGLTFTQIENQQTSKYLQSLIDINNKLYEPTIIDHQITTLIPTNASSNGLDSNFNYKYYSEGYDATHDLVDDKEIEQWKNNFHYLRITGIGIENTNEINNDINHPLKDNHINIEMNNPNHYVEDINNINTFDNDSLCIIGKTAIIHKIISCNSNIQEVDNDDDNDNEMIYKHGILEDYIIYNNEDKYQEYYHSVNMKSNLNNNSIHNNINTLEQEEDSSMIPMMSMKEEVISSIMDVLWPTIVDSFKPLIKNVVEVANNHHIPYHNDNNDNNIDVLNKQQYKYKNTDTDDIEINEFHHEFQDLW